MWKKKQHETPWTEEGVHTHELERRRSKNKEKKPSPNFAADLQQFKPSNWENAKNSQKKKKKKHTYTSKREKDFKTTPSTHQKQ